MDYAVTEVLMPASTPEAVGFRARRRWLETRERDARARGWQDDAITIAYCAHWRGEAEAVRRAAVARARRVEAGRNSRQLALSWKNN